MPDFNQGKLNEVIRDLAMQEVFHHRTADRSVDKEAWYSDVEGRLRAEHQDMVKWFVRHGLAVLVDEQCNYALRHATAAVEVQKSRSRQRLWGQIPSDTEPGKFVAKNIKDWTVGEVRLLHEFQTGKVRSHRKTADFLRLIISVAEALGMSDQDTVAGIIKIIAS